jgi:hypothetical protein
LIGSCASDFGHVCGRRPVNGVSPKSTSATPSPSLPGSQEATSAGISGIRSEMIIGRPATTSTTHFIAPQTLSTAAASPSDRVIFCALEPVMETSPAPSAYGVSPTTTIPTSDPVMSADASLL